MDDTVKLNHLDALLDELSYPISRATAVERCGDVTLQLADGEENLGELLTHSNDERFESRDDLRNEILGLLPQQAVGEPYQSEGEG
ncbi:MULTISPECIES: hypothetical protein [unclassified Haladaptatus]|uniref:DUF5789 family protein n=1 Tax=unclassified Haladaptatus TaxID=2622732 RepID=UPI0023E81B51|nr:MULTISPECIES: hypothetical protein [unclassified Haladaptatus]